MSSTVPQPASVTVTLVGADDWFGRYSSGDREAVWAEMVALGPSIRDESFREGAERVAAETMTRVRANVETLVERLHAAGYEFQRPDEVHVLPTDELLGELEDLESRHGPLPLSLRSFYAIVGTVDLSQSLRQLVQWQRPDRPSASELHVLGEYDPLVVERLDPDGPQPGWFYFAPDEFHKANYSGGENYHVVLPDPRADFPIRGMYEIDELFVSYLRACFAWGGFRGRVEGDELRCWKTAPDLEITNTLAAGLLPI